MGVVGGGGGGRWRVKQGRDVGHFHYSFFDFAFDIHTTLGFHT